MDHDRIPLMMSISEGVGPSSLVGEHSFAVKRHKKLPCAAHMRRKKWTEEEEDTLITKYGELLHSGVLARLKTREKKFEPIAEHVNALHHAQDPIAFPWEWTWRDATTKVQNMRHQYLGVKQKIRRIVDTLGSGPKEEYEWESGINHWPNFLKYKVVFGDVELDSHDFVPRGSIYNSGNMKCMVGRIGPWEGMRGGTPVSIRESGLAGDIREVPVERQEAGIVPAGLVEGTGTGAIEAGTDVLGLGVGTDYDCLDEEEGVADTCDEDAERENGEANGYRYRNKKRKMGKGIPSGSGILNFFVSQFSELRDREAIREERERQREREKEERTHAREEAERSRERQRDERQRLREEHERAREGVREEREQAREEREREYWQHEHERWEEQRQSMRDWEEKRERERMEWRERMLKIQYEQQSMMMQVQAQLAQGQQNLVSLLLGILLQLAGSGNEIPGQVGALSPFVSQILQNLQQTGDGDVQTGDKRAAGGSNNNQFFVDG